MSAALTGCPDPTETWLSLEFTLESDSSVAGTAVPYTAELVAESGTRLEVEVDIASDLEEALAYTADDVTGTLQGEHLLTATASHEGGAFVADAPLTVLVGELAILDLVLDSPIIAASEATGYAVSGTDAYGNPVELGEVTITPAADITLEDDELTGTLAGTFDVTAESLGVTDTEPLEVTPGEVHEVDLTLTSNDILAGESVTWSAQFWDTWGNEIETAAADVTADSADVAITGSDVTTTLTGDYVVRIDVTEGHTPWDTEWLHVTAAEAASIELTLSPSAPEVLDPVTASVIILDIYGNVSDEPWTLDMTAEPGSDIATVVVAQPVIEFTADGWFSATATVDSNGISDVIGPFLVDSYGPEIVLTHPPRGYFSTAYSDTVTGTITDIWSGVTSATCNGDALTLAGDGSFSYPVSWDFGTNVIETLAVDGDGNPESDRRAVLAGAFIPEGTGIGDGIVARINEAAIDVLETLGEDMIENADVAGMIPSPVFYDKSETCTWLGCWTWWEIALYVNNPTLGSTDLEIDPMAGGYLQVYATIYNINVPWSASGVISEVGYSANGTITADSITIGMRIYPSVSNGAIQTTISDVTVNSINFDFDFDSWIYDIIDFFGIDVDGMVQDYVEDAIESAVVDEVPPLLEDTLQDLELATSLELLGADYNLLAEPYDIAVDDDGITLGLETTFTPDVWANPYTGEGSLYYGYSVPSYSSTPAMTLSLSEDFLNQALYAFWGGGLLSQTFAAADLGLDPADLAMFMPNMTDPYIVLDAMLPPVVLPGSGGELLDLQLGDLGVSLYSDDPADPANLVMTFYVGLEAGLDLTVTANATLAANITVDDTWFDVVYPVFPNGLGTDMEDLLDLLVPALTPLLTDAIGEIPIPEFSGFTMDNLTIETAGAENGYVDVGGDLVAL